MNFLVTGGAGFIGSHITERLLKEGHSVCVLDNFSSGREENLKFASGLSAASYTLIKGDIRNYADCLRAASDVDFCLHQAALRSVPKSLFDPYAYNQVNIDGTLNMLRACREAKVSRFVLASSSSIYGDTDIFPQEEGHLPRPISPYALSKIAGEHYCRVFASNYGLQCVALRYFNVFGPRQALDDEYSVVIPKFITAMLADEPPPVHGDGRQSRDFTYIDNVVQANILSATKEGQQGFAAFNVACGEDMSILSLVDVLNKIMGKDIAPVFEPTRPGDVRRTLADIGRIKSTLDYSPAVDFEQGLRKTVEWFRQKDKQGVQDG